MRNENLEYRRFTIAKYIVSNSIYNDYIHYENAINSLLEELTNKKDMSDSCILLKMVKKECREHNALNKSARTRLDNLRYNTKVFQSNLFKKYLNVSLSQIDKAIKQNEQMDDYDIYYKYFN